eukprot:g47969.t1
MFHVSAPLVLLGDSGHKLGKEALPGSHFARGDGTCSLGPCGISIAADFNGIAWEFSVGKFPYSTSPKLPDLTQPNRTPPYPYPTTTITSPCYPPNPTIWTQPNLTLMGPNFFHPKSPGARPLPGGSSSTLGSLGPLEGEHLLGETQVSHAQPIVADQGKGGQCLDAGDVGLVEDTGV